MSRSAIVTVDEDDDDLFDIVIVGGGVVGCAIFRQLVNSGHKCCLLEKNGHVVQGASKGNSGISCTGYDAPLGSIERKCIRRAMQLSPLVYAELGLPSNKCGSLVVAWNAKELAQLPKIVAENHAIGDLDVKQLTPPELYELEPNLAAGAEGAVLIPGEVIVEPWLIPIALLQAGIQNGGRARMDHKVVSGKFKSISDDDYDDAKFWQLFCSNGTRVLGRCVINCAGNFGDIVEQIHEERPAFNIFPRKGQFVIFEQPPPTEDPLIVRPIQPVPTDATKGVFVFRTLYGNIVVGPTAEEQGDREMAVISAETEAKLLDYAYRVVPKLKTAKIVGRYAGLRPATQFRDYQIRLDKNCGWITVAGIRSTGVTACLGIAEYVGELVEELDLRRSSGQQNCGSGESGRTVAAVVMPTIQDLAKMYNSRGDGTVVIHGTVHQIDHPITILGCEGLVSRGRGK